MHDHNNKCRLDERTLTHRRERKKLRAKIVTYVILSQFAIGILGFILIYSITFIQARIETKTRDRLATADYPIPNDNTNANLIFTDHLGGTNIGTNWLVSKHTVEGTKDRPGSILVKAYTRFDGKTRDVVSLTISMNFAATGSLSLPVKKNSHHLLVLASERTIEIKSSTFEMQLASMFDLPDQNSGMLFSVPTEFLLEALQQNALTAQIGEHTIIFSNESLDAFRDLAAYLKPGISVPD